MRKVATPEVFFEFSKFVFTEQERFFDDSTWNLSREQIYEQLLDIAGKVGVDKEAIQSQLSKNLEIKQKGILNHGKFH